MIGVGQQIRSVDHAVGDAVKVYLNEVRYLANARCSMAEMAGVIAGDDE